MVKVFFSSLFFLLIVGCSEQEATEKNMINIQAAMLKGLCENESTCFNKIDTSAESCRQKTYDLKNFDKLSEMDQMITGGEFVACIIRKMDQGFQDRFDQAMPVTETNVQMGGNLHKDPTELLIRVDNNGVHFEDKFITEQTVPLRDIKVFIEDNGLDGKYSRVKFMFDKNIETGNMVEVMDIFKKAGFENISIAAGKH